MKQRVPLALMKQRDSTEVSLVRSFVVRIYRAGETDERAMLGTVQSSESDVALPFASPKELIRILEGRLHPGKADLDLALRGRS